MGSYTFRVDGTPWMSQQEGVYEDWYLLKGFEVLGVLNEKAVSGSMRPVHNSAAHMSGDGKGGLFGLVKGSADYGSKYALWISKSWSEDYESFYRKVLEEAGSLAMGLWRRQLAMGPSPEFCIFAAQPLRSFEHRRPIVLMREVVWSSDTE
jgi:hypothetical protein